MKTAFVFPGQGAQYVGMADDFRAAYPKYEQILKDFDDAHQTTLGEIMTSGPQDTLKQTRYTQPAILFHSMCALKAFEEKCNLKPDYVAGHSLGEFSALVASGMLTWQDAMHLVHKRGEFMIEAVGETPFAMAAVIGLDSDTVAKACEEASQTSLVMAVNFNTPIQTVISGTAEGVSATGKILKEKGAKRVLPLVVGGPFHTPLIDRASGWLGDEMLAVPFADGQIPVVSNLDATASISGAESRYKLERQIISPVLWIQSVKTMLDAGVKRFIEFGPQTVLSSMIKNIDKEAQTMNVDKLEDLDALVSALR